MQTSDFFSSSLNIMCVHLLLLKNVFFYDAHTYLILYAVFHLNCAERNLSTTSPLSNDCGVWEMQENEEAAQEAMRTKWRNLTFFNFETHKSDATCSVKSLSSWILEINSMNFPVHNFGVIYAIYFQWLYGSIIIHLLR